MPPRRSGRASNAAAAAAIKRATDSPTPEDSKHPISLDTPSTNTNTTRSSTAGTDSPLTPATSVSDEDIGASKPARGSASSAKRAKIEDDPTGAGFSVVIPPRPKQRRTPGKAPAKDANIEQAWEQSVAEATARLTADSSITPSGKRKRGFVPASQLKQEPSDDDVTFVSETLSRRPSSTRRRPRKSLKEDSSDDDTDDAPLATTSKSKGKQRLIDDEEAERAFKIADDMREFAFDSDEAEQVEEESDFEPRARSRKRNSKKTADQDDDPEDDDDWLSAAGDDNDDDDSDSEGSDYSPDSAWGTKRRQRRRRAADTETPLSGIETPSVADNDEFETIEDVDVPPGDEAEGSTSNRGRYAEDLQYETAKQRAARIKSEKFAARRKKKPALTHFEKTNRDLIKQHPELNGVWDKLSQQPTFSKKQKAEQPTGLTISLLPFQLEGLNWLVQQEKGEWKGGILADEMGMGKTIQMISLFLSDRAEQEGPTLVVAPTVAIMQWRNEIAKYTSDFKVCVWHGASREADVSKLQKFDVILTSYAVLESSYRKQEAGFKRKGELLKEKSAVHSIFWHRIVLDEAHNIKERSTNTAKGAFALSGNYRWCLSGTPLQNRVGELYSMIRFLNGDPYAYYYCKRCPCKSLHWQFSDRRSCDKCGHTPMHHVCLWNIAILRPIQRTGTTSGDGKTSFGRLRTLLEKIMLRRTKLERADDMGLPPRTLVVRRDYFNDEELDLYDSLYQAGATKFSTFISAGTVLNNYSNIFTLLTRMRQMACHPDLVLRSKTGLAQGLIGAEADDSIHLCRICAEEATDPISSKCRHVFCRECVRQYLDAAQDIKNPDCPYCHAQLSIDLEQEALQEVVQHETRQGILSKINLEKWRSSTKIEALVEELNNVRRDDSTIKSIVFSQFVNFLDLITFRLQRAGFKVCRLEGNMTPEARDRTIRYFMDTPDVTVFLVSLKAGGVALNLTEASRVYLMDPWWNGAVSAQAMDRIHRLGQRRPIVIKQMIVEDSIEARMLELQEKKQNMVNATLANDDSAVSRLSVADLKFLFCL